jgi:hypothetical protein
MQETTSTRDYPALDHAYWAQPLGPVTTTRTSAISRAVAGPLVPYVMHRPV